MTDSGTLLYAIAENLFLYGVMFFVTIAIVITVHELGHFFAAKLCGVHIEQFSFGFGVEVFGFGGQKNEGMPDQTRWSICALPIGGYVKLFGDVDPNKPEIWDKEKEEPRLLSKDELEVAYCTKSVWQRLFIVFSGPAINILLTVLIFFIAFTTYGERSKRLSINMLLIDSPAANAGIQIGDTLLTMDGEALRRLDDAYDVTLMEMPPKPHSYEILRDGETLDIAFTAREIEYTNTKGVDQHHGQTGMLFKAALGFEFIDSVQGVSTKDDPEKARELIQENLGNEIKIEVTYRDEDSRNGEKDIFFVHPSSEHNEHLDDPQHEHYDRVFFHDPEDILYVRLPVLEAFERSFWKLWVMTEGSYKLIMAASKGKTDEPMIGGVGKISEKTGAAAKAGLYDYFMFIAGFSFMIALINLLPIPVLDGGHIVFLTYEIISGQRVSPRIESAALIIGLVFLLGIMIIANVSDFVTFVNDSFSER